MEGLTVTGGTASAVRTIHSGLQVAGSIPSALRSSSGILSSLSRTSLAVSLWLSLTSLKVVGLSSLILICSAPQ